MDETYGWRVRVEAPGVDVDHHRRATAASAETVIGIYGAARTSPRPVAASEIDEEAFQTALEILRARWRRERDARRSLFPQDEIAAGVRETAPPPAPALEDPVVWRALDSLRAHAERQTERAQDLPATPPPSLEDLELEVPFASGVAELELQPEIEITDSIALVRRHDPAPLTEGTGRSLRRAARSTAWRRPSCAPPPPPSPPCSPPPRPAWRTRSASRPRPGGLHTRSSSRTRAAPRSPPSSRAGASTCSAPWGSVTSCGSATTPGPGRRSSSPSTAATSSTAGRPPGRSAATSSSPTARRSSTATG